jgi:hypothetical protein
MMEERIERLHEEEDNARTGQPLSTADLAQRTDAGSGTAAATRRALDTTDSRDRAPLFPEDELAGLRQRWQAVQGGFVDDPRTAVGQADELVASAMKRLAEVFADERGKLEHEWDKGENVSTEDLRQALRRYRSFFDRLLSV